MSHNLIKICTALSVILLASCSGRNKWTVEGNIEGADGDLLALEASNNGIWYQIDTITLDEKGDFKFSNDAAGFPDIYRLRIGDESVYFPIDSIETVKVEAKAPFGSAYLLEGSEDAKSFVRVNLMVDQMIRAKGAEAAVTDPELKKALGQEVVANPSSMTAYYIINKKIGNYALFNPADKKDLRVIGAVANAFNTKRPLDPRTGYLKSLYLSNRQRSANSLSSDTIVAIESKLIDIELFNEKGNKVRLSDVASEGKVVVLNFTALTAEKSPAFNIELAKTYDACRERGLQVYQVAVDPDEYAWRQSAKNLPWITVYANPSVDARALTDYNVTVLPITFIINRQGELSERVEDITKLRSAVEKYL